jgi:phosphatidylinositol glycan class Q protein
MAVDTLLGVISLLFVYFNVQRLLGFIHKYGSTIHIAVLSEEVEWLMGFPAGLKTNKPLNSVMGQAILQIMLLWNHITTFVTPYEPYLVQVMLGFCLFGVTFQVALASDLINICTIHVYYIYRSLMFLYR